MNSSIIGIDIRRGAIHIATVNVRLGGKSVTACASAPLNTHDEPAPALTAALAPLAETFGFANAACAVALPSDQAYYRNLKLPIGKKEKIRQILPFELESTLATPVDSLQIDFQKSPHSTPGGQHPVVAVAVETEALAAVKTALEDAGITASSITIGAWPLAHLLAKNCPPDQSCLLLDADPPFGTLYYLAPNEIKWARGFRLPPHPDKLRQQVVREVQATWTACQARESEPSIAPNRIYLHGLGPDRLDETIAVMPGQTCPVIPIQSNQILNSDTFPQDWEPTTLNNALALALAQHQGAQLIEFGARGWKFDRFLEKQRPRLIQLAVLTGIVLLLAVGNLWIDNHYVTRHLSELNLRIEDHFTSTFPDVTRVAAPRRQMASKVSELKKELGQHQTAGRNVRVVDILHSISETLPSPLKVSFSSTFIGPEMMTLDGKADSFRTVDEVKAHLDDIPWVRTATISAAKMNRSGKEVNFKLRLNFTSGNS